MTVPSTKKCPICKTIDKYYQGSLLKNKFYTDKLYARLVLKTFKNGEKTACLSVDIREARMHYCPFCGRPIRLYARGKQDIEQIPE